MSVLKEHEAKAVQKYLAVITHKQLWAILHHLRDNTGKQTTFDSLAQGLNCTTQWQRRGLSQRLQFLEKQGLIKQYQLNGDQESKDVKIDNAQRVIDLTYLGYRVLGLMVEMHQSLIIHQREMFANLEKLVKINGKSNTKHARQKYLG